MTGAPTPAAEEIVTSCLLDATPEDVWAAFADPARLAGWWGPEGWESRFEAFDFRPEGEWRFAARAPDGAEHRVEARFATLEPARRIVVDHVSEPRHRMEFLLERRGRQTEVVLRVAFAEEEAYARLRRTVRQAVEQTFDRLGRDVFRHLEQQGR